MLTSASAQFATPLLDRCLHAIVVHRMMTVNQLQRLLAPDTKVTQLYKRISELADAGWIESIGVRGESGRPIKVWLPTTTGVDRALSDPDLNRRHIPKPASHRSLVAHTLAVNEVGIAFVQAARDNQNAGHECDALAWEHEVAHSLSSDRKTGRLICDAVLSYLMPNPTGGAVVARRFVELDRGTEPVHVLHDKLRRYAAYKAYVPTGPAVRDTNPEPYWKQRYPAWPTLCVVVGANPAKTQAAMFRRINTVANLVHADPVFTRQQVPILFAHFDDLVTQGPLADVWWRPGVDQPMPFTGNAP